MLVCDWLWLTALACAITGWLAFCAGLSAQAERDARSIERARRAAREARRTAL